jgi:hypothetical protein
MTDICAEISITCQRANLTELSTITRLLPSGGHEMGSLSRNGIPFDNSQWKYETDIIETYYTEDVSKLLIKDLSENFSALKAFVNNNNCDVAICFLLRNQTELKPALTIDKEMIQFAAQLNAYIYFD